MVDKISRGIYGGQNDSGTGFSQSIFVFPCQYYSANAPVSLNVSPLLCNHSN